MMNNTHRNEHVCFHCYQTIINNIGIHPAYLWEQSCLYTCSKLAFVFDILWLEFFEDLEKKGYISLFELSPKSFAIKANGYKEILRKGNFIGYFCIGNHDKEMITQ